MSPLAAAVDGLPAQRTQAPVRSGINDAVATEYDHGVPAHHLAVLTGTSTAAVTEMIRATGRRIRDHGEAPDPWRVLWNCDPTVLAALMHHHRPVVDPRATQCHHLDALGGQLRMLVTDNLAALLANIAALDVDHQPGAVLRVLITVAPTGAATVGSGTSAAQAALTEVAVAVAASAPPEIGACIRAWLALLHAGAGRYNDALEHSDAEGGYLAVPAPGRGDDPHAELTFWWRRAAVLAAAGEHAAAMGVHAHVAGLLLTPAGALDVAQPAARDLLLARNAAAWGSQALAGGAVSEAAEHLQRAIDVFDGLLERCGTRELNRQVLLHERALARFTAGYALHRHSPVSARALWRTSAHELARVQLRDPDQRRCAVLLSAQAEVAAHGTVIPPWPAPGARLVLPRFARALVRPALVGDPTRWQAHTAPHDALPWLVSLHHPCPDRQVPVQRLPVTTAARRAGIPGGQRRRAAT